MPVDQKNNAERAYDHIRRQMLAGRLRAGTRLSDTTLALEIGVSRTPVREALIRLQNEGFVEQVPRIGIFVRVPEYEELLELHDIRRLLESHAAARAARRITPEQLAELKKHCDELHAVAVEVRRRKPKRMPPDLSPRGVLADVKFHMLILEASGSPRIRRIATDLQLMTHLCGHAWLAGRKLRHPVLHSAAHTWLDHYRIYRAIKRGKPREARYWMLKHHRPVKQVAADLRRMHRYLVEGKPVAHDWPESVRQSIHEIEELARPGPAKRRSPVPRAR